MSDKVNDIISEGIEEAFERGYQLGIIHTMRKIHNKMKEARKC